MDNRRERHRAMGVERTGSPWRKRRARRASGADSGRPPRARRPERRRPRPWRRRRQQRRRPTRRRRQQRRLCSGGGGLVGGSLGAVGWRFWRRLMRGWRPLVAVRCARCRWRSCRRRCENCVRRRPARGEGGAVAADRLHRAPLRRRHSFAVHRAWRRSCCSASTPAREVSPRAEPGGSASYRAALARNTVVSMRGGEHLLKPPRAHPLRSLSPHPYSHPRTDHPCAPGGSGAE